MSRFFKVYGWPLVVGLLVALLLIERFPQWVGLPNFDLKIQQAPAYKHVSGSGPVSYADAVSHASPAVANLYTAKLVSKPLHPLYADPTFKQFYGDNLPRQKRMESSLGTAVLMSKEGYLLTNNHVTAGADQIIVALKDGRETLARVIGSDPETDLAVLKIDLPDLPAITLGHSESIRIGDVVLAIGNPFGVGQTVTMGIISATGRNQLGLNTYEDFIQTHIDSGADMTVLYNEDGDRCGNPTTFFDLDNNGKLIGVYSSPEKPPSDKTSMGTLIMHRELFVDLLSNMMSQGIQDASFLTFLRLFNSYDIRGYKFEGECLRINSIQSYFNETMRVLSDPTRSAIFYGENPIFTKVKDEAPTYYNDSCVVDNSIISDGCVIQGTVQDSMLFRGVTVSGQSKVNNCVLFQDTFISEGCQLENVIIDKNSVIRPGTKLIGNPNYPIVIGKGVIV